MYPFPVHREGEMHCFLTCFIATFQTAKDLHVKKVQKEEGKYLPTVLGALLSLAFFFNPFLYFGSK